MIQVHTLYKIIQKGKSQYAITMSEKSGIYRTILDGLMGKYHVAQYVGLHYMVGFVVTYNYRNQWH